MSSVREASLVEMVRSWRFVMLVLLHFSNSLSILPRFILPMAIICGVDPALPPDEHDNVTRSTPTADSGGNITQDSGGNLTREIQVSIGALRDVIFGPKVGQICPKLDKSNCPHYHVLVDSGSPSHTISKKSEICPNLEPNLASNAKKYHKKV